MKLTPLTIQAIGLEAGLLNPKSWVKRKADNSVVYILAHGSDDARQTIELQRNAKEADVRKAVSERAA